MKILNKVSIASVLVFAFVLGFTGSSTANAAGPSVVNLGSAGDFVLLGKTGISTTGTTAITGDIGVSPAAATYITGFGLIMDTSNTFSTSSLVTGKVYAADYTAPTPTKMTTAISNMETAYTDAAGRTNPTATELGSGNIGGLTIAPGLYKWGTSVIVPTDVTLSGSTNDVWIFQIAQDLSLSSGVHINLAGGAKAENIFWQVAGQTTLGTTSVFNGNILDQTAVVFNTGATLNGRALAQTAVTLDSNSVIIPAVVSVTPTPEVTPTPVVTPTTTVNTTVTPTSTTITPVTTVTAATGCLQGNAFNTATGASCTPPISASEGCLQGNMFNTVTGTACTSVVVSVDTGCLQGNKFSITTGNTCTSFVPNVSTNTTTSTVSTTTTPANFGQLIKSIAVNLNMGSKGDLVRSLQEFLISQDKGPKAKALDAHGTTLNFGSLTKAALAEWQEAVGISPALGNFGPITRTFISAN
ncbi:MAG: ice-binding family protein [Minisyncoccia bacterium]